MKRIYQPSDFIIPSELGIIDGAIEMIAVNKDLRLALRFNDSVQDYSNYSNVPLASNRLYYSDTAKVFKSWHQNGITGFLKYDHSLIELRRNKPFSFSFWMKPQYAGRYQAFISNNVSYSGVSFGMSTYQDNIAINLSHSNGVNTVLQYDHDFSQYNAVGSEFQHIAVTYDGSGDYANGMKIYHNGTDVTPSCTLTDNLAGNDFYNTQPILIGNYMSNYGNGFAGFLDDFRVYSLALSPTQIAEIYNNGDGSEEYRHEAGLFKAIANIKSDVTYLKQWTGASEGSENSGTTYTILEDDGNEYYWNGTNLEITEGTNRNTVSELSEYLQIREKANIRPVVYLSSTGTNNPKFAELDCGYIFNPSKKFTILQDDNSVQVQAYYTNEKKRLEIEYENTNISDMDDITIELQKDGTAVKNWAYGDLILDADNNKAFYFDLDLSGIESGSYFLVITLIKDTNFKDISKNVMIIVL